MTDSPAVGSAKPLSESQNHPQDKPHVGVLALTLELYEQLAPELRPGRENWLTHHVLPKLEQHARVSFDGAAFTQQAVQQRVDDLQAQGADLLVVVLLSYAPSQIALHALARTNLPIVIWNIAQLQRIDQTYDQAAMVQNHGVHGTHDLANVLTRHQVPFDLVSEHPDDANFASTVMHHANAARVRRKLRSLRIGALGYPFPGMGDFAIDTTRLACDFGVSVVPLGLDVLNQRARQHSDADVQQLISRYRSAYRIDDAVGDEDLDAAARYELALSQMIQQDNLGAMTYQFLTFADHEQCPTLPFIAACRLMQQGIGFAGEGDVLGAMHTWLVHQVTGASTFSEIFSVDYAGQGLMMSHMGEINCDAAQANAQAAANQSVGAAHACKPRMVARHPIAPTTCRQLTLIPAFEPGDMTLVALSQGPDQTWRLIVSRMHCRQMQPLPKLTVPHFMVDPIDMDVRHWLDAYGKLGGPHHHAICRGDQRKAFQVLAQHLNASYHEI